MTSEGLAARVAESRAEQGLPARVEDPAVLAKVGVLLAVARPEGVKPAS